MIQNLQIIKGTIDIRANIKDLKITLVPCFFNLSRPKITRKGNVNGAVYGLIRIDKDKEIADKNIFFLNKNKDRSINMTAKGSGKTLDE